MKCELCGLEYFPAGKTDGHIGCLKADRKPKTGEKKTIGESTAEPEEKEFKGSDIEGKK